MSKCHRDFVYYEARGYRRVFLASEPVSRLRLAEIRGHTFTAQGSDDHQKGVTVLRYKKSMSRETFWDRESTSEHDFAPTTVIEEPMGMLRETVLPVSYADFQRTGTMTTRQELRQLRRANLSLILYYCKLQYARYVVTLRYSTITARALQGALCFVLFFNIGDVRLGVRFWVNDDQRKLNFEIETLFTAVFISSGHVNSVSTSRRR